MSRPLEPKAPAPPDNPWQMDLVDLQTTVYREESKTGQLEQSERTGHTLALAGMSGLFASMAIGMAQSIATGALPATLSIPIVAVGGTSLGMYSYGLIKRDNASSELLFQRDEVRHLKDVLNHRMEKL